MLSKADNRKKIDEISGTGRFANDLETISKALFADKTLRRLPSSGDCCRSMAVGESHLSEPKTKPGKAKDNKKDSVKEKKPSIWSWRGLKALTYGRNRRFNCCFSLLVHSVESLPSLFDDVCLVVHWKRPDGELMTSPTRVHEGAAKFEEQLIHSCSVNVTRSSTQNLAKYEAKHVLLYASVYNAPELDLGKNHIDLTRLLPLTLEELEEEKSSGKWTTSFKLSGKASGATMNVSFGYIAVGNSREPSGKNITPDILSLRQNRATTETFVDQLDLKNELNIRRVGSLPASLATLMESGEDIKDLHEVLPMPTSELYQSVNVLYQKLDEDIPNASVENKLDTGIFPPHLDSRKVNSFKLPDSDQQNLETVREIGEFSVTEKGIEEFPKEQVRPENDPCKVALASGEVIETDGIVEVTLNKEDTLPPSAKDIVSQKHEQSVITCNSTEKENGMLSKELLMKELELALSYTSDLMNEELDSQEDESEASFQESFSNNNSQHGDLGKGKSSNLDDITDSVANDFLKMLNLEHNSPFGLSSGSEPDSPRERLLKEFEKDALASGGILNFAMENDPTEFVSDIPTGSVWEAMSNDFYQSSILEGFREISQTEPDVFSRRASRLEDMETEALMRDWGMNEKAFQHSPPSESDGFCNPVNELPEDLDQQLPSLSEGLGPFLQTENGGFLRSMNPALFRNARSGGSLIMQASSPVVVPAEMGSGVMDILQGLASMGIEKLSMQANKLMPLEDITGKTIQQIAWEAAPSLERQGLSQHEFEIMQNISNGQNHGKGISSGPGLGKCGSTLLGNDTEYVSLEDLAPSAMDKIEALSIEGLRVQSGMTDEDAPSNISSQSIGEVSALKGKSVDVGGTIGLDGIGGLQLLDIKDKCDNVDGLMGLSLTLDEWMKLDSGEINDDDLVSERTSRLLSAHHATSLDLFRGKSKGEKRRGRGRKYGLLGNSFTVALMVQLRDPLRNYEPVGNPMLALIQVERVFVPPRPKIYRTVPLARNASEEEKEPTTATNKENIIEKPIEDMNHEEELIPLYKINEVHVAGLKVEPGKKKLWGSKNQQQSGSRWLLANGMGKKNKHPLMKSKAVVKSSGPASSPSTTTVQPGDTLWSISSRVNGTGAKWKDLAALNPHIRNPNVILPNETIRLR